MQSSKIAILHYSAPPVVGGVEMVMQQHARLLSEKGHQVTIFAGKGEIETQKINLLINPLFNSSHSEILVIKKKLDQGLIPSQFLIVKDKIFDYLRHELTSFDLIIAHNICSLQKNLPLTAALHEFIQDLNAPPLIAWHHDLAWGSKQYQKELYKEWPWDLLKTVWHPDWQVHVAVSEMRQKEISRIFGLQEEAISVVPSGLDWKNFLCMNDQTEKIILRYGLLDAHPVFLLPVRITRRKNIELAIQIMASLSQTFPDAVLVITGPPGPHNPNNASYFEELIRLREELGLTKDGRFIAGKPRVIFLAENDDRFLPDEVIADLFRFCDALLLPSEQEGFGIPVLEAGLVGMPIFCSDIQPFRETAGEQAVFFDPQKNPQEIATRIVSAILMDNRISLKKRIRQKYTWSQIGKNLIDPVVEKGLRIRKDKKQEYEKKD